MEFGLSGGECGEYGEDLLSHHGQHLDVDAVELVVAHPGPCLFGRDTHSKLKPPQTTTPARSLHTCARPENMRPIDL